MSASVARYTAHNATWGLLVSLPVALALFCRWDDLRPLVERLASSEVGRAVHIGHLDVELSRQPRLILDRVTVANPGTKNPGAKSGGASDGSTMASVGRLAVSLDVAKLLQGKIELPEIAVDRPSARLERAPSGHANWEGLGGAPSSGKSSFAMPMPHIGRFVVRDGVVRFADPRLKADVTLRLHTIPGRSGGPPKVVVDGTGTYDGAATKIAGEVGSLLTLATRHVRYPVDLRWDVGPTHIRLDGTVDDPTRFSGLQGTLSMAGPDLAKLYTLTGIPIPPSPPYDLQGRVAYANDVVTLSGFHGTLGSSDLGGDLRVDLKGAKPRLDGQLVSQRVVFADLAGFVGGTPGKADAPNATAARKALAAADKASARSLPTTPIDLEKLNAIDAHIRYRGDHVQADYLPLDDLTADLDLENGRLRMRPLAFGIGGGAIDLDLDIDGRAKPVRVDADVGFRNLDLKRVMAQTKLFDGAGSIDGHATLRSTGTSVAQVMANGDGGLSVVMSNGHIDALLVELAGLDVTESLGYATGLKLKNNSRYDIRCMVADAGMKQGVLSTNAFVFDTTDTNISGRAKIDFHGETLDARITPHPKDMSILSFRSPLDVRGTLKHPSVAPDPVWLGGRIAASIVLGVVATPLGALIPTIDLGTGKDADCAGLIANARAGTAPPQTAAVTAAVPVSPAQAPGH